LVRKRRIHKNEPFLGLRLFPVRLGLHFFRKAITQKHQGHFMFEIRMLVRIRYDIKGKGDRRVYIVDATIGANVH
jgi:hypothetical protein